MSLKKLGLTVENLTLISSQVNLESIKWVDCNSLQTELAQESMMLAALDIDTSTKHLVVNKDLLAHEI